MHYISAGDSSTFPLRLRIAKSKLYLCDEIFKIPFEPRNVESELYLRDQIFQHSLLPHVL